MRSFILICLLLVGIFTMQTTAAAAPSSDKPPPFDQVLLDNGFEPVESALKKCEADAHRELSLPYKLPPVPFTFQLAQFRGCSEGLNDNLRIEYLNEKHGKIHYIMDIRPIERKLSFRKTRAKHVYKLKDGSEALFLEYRSPKKLSKHERGFNALVSEHEGWQYYLAIDCRIQKQVPAEALVAIANSVR
ncbi:hypothetical protein PCCS19_42840 [Paenibacillus sp. CCS19]|uniref:hypothetical protein n=1 Tax=Paenibacillus sp. CCS19 TaxID=3158387 RepID=UPI00256E86B0|nr:hypothetical protein [Paenibacillus cellulosilyticus]GMK41228.1 hypothetical protein PCCS19_42840 [Paenibacillus cellulosilyticus]